MSEDKEGSGQVSMFPLLLKCVYVCKTAHKEHFSVQIHLVLQRQPRILIKTNNIFVFRSSEINTVLHQSKVKPPFTCVK